MASSNNSLDTLIVKATNPLVDSPDPLDVASFCEKVTHEDDGPQIAVKLLAYRIHSPQEKEALNALALLEQCVKSCGPSFHSEIGKFRFLNELIKLVSPKYQAHRTPNQVKHRILEILYTWTIDMKSESKIQEAYDMLKKQGVIKENPNYLGTSLPQQPAVSPREKTPFFDNSEKDALLQKLLKSKNPDDLQAANRLIKSMVREEENRLEAASRRQLEIATVNSNIRLLEELLDNYEANGASPEEMELCKELASNCDKLRPNLSKLATETDDKGDSLADILQTSDELSHVLERFENWERRSSRLPAPTPQLQGAALDLLDLGPVVSQPKMSPHSAMDDQLLSLGLDDFATTPTTPSFNLLQPFKLETNGTSPVQQTPESKIEPAAKPRGFEELDVLGEALIKQNLSSTSKPIVGFHQKAPEKVPLNMLAKKKMLDEHVLSKESTGLAVAGEVIAPVRSAPPSNIPMDFDLLMQNSPKAAYSAQDSSNEASSGILVPASVPQIIHASNENAEKPNTIDSDVCMLDSASSPENGFAGGNDDVQLLHSPPPIGLNQTSATTVLTTAPSLADISLKFEDIKPSTKSPAISLLSQESGLNVNLHSASAQVPKNVSVFVLSATSCSPSPLMNFTFQAIVPKGNRVKLQPPSDNKLPAFNPFLPPPAITQILMLSTVGLNLIELKYVVSYDVDGETVTEMGTVKELALCPNVQ